MKIVSVVGARPNFMKVASILAAIREQNRKSLGKSVDHKGSGAELIDHVLVHTGQHYDELMSDVFFADLNLPRPDGYLGVGSGSHAFQTAEIMKRFEEVLLREQPDVVVVVGDVNSTLACALVSAKIAFDTKGRRPLLAHVEAGLRSFDRSMPEECNRTLTDHLSDLLFVTEESGLKNLGREGIARSKIFFVGNTMIDSLLTFRDAAEKSTILDELDLRAQFGGNGVGRRIKEYALLTLHRPASVDSRKVLLDVLEALQELAASCPIIFPVHPRTRERIQQFRLNHYFLFHDKGCQSLRNEPRSTRNGILVVPPLGYLDFLCLMKHARLVLTDSGGIQEETTCLGIPCVTLRDNTERPVTVTNGTNLVAGITTRGIRKAIHRQLTRKIRVRMPKRWDGRSGARILEVIQREFQRAFGRRSKRSGRKQGSTGPGVRPRTFALTP